MGIMAVFRNVSLKIKSFTPHKNHLFFDIMKYLLEYPRYKSANSQTQWQYFVTLKNTSGMGLPVLKPRGNV